MSTYTNITGWQTSTAYKTNDVVAVTPFGYQIVSLGYESYVTGSYVVADAGVFKDGSKVDTANATYNVTKINVSDGAISSTTGNYDIANFPAQVSALTAYLNAMTSEDFCILWSHDQPDNNHTNGSLPAAVYNIGGSPQKYEERIYSGGAYVALGRGDIKESNGLDFVAGQGVGDPNAAVEISFFIPPTGYDFNIQKATEYYICLQDHTSSSVNKPPQKSSTYRNGESGTTWSTYWADMSTFVWTPDYTTSMDFSHMAKSSSAVDSIYSEEKPDSLNAEKQKYTLQFRNIGDRQLQAILTFLKYHHDRSFLFNNTYSISPNTNKYNILDYSHVWQNFNRHDLEMVIEERF